MRAFLAGFRVGFLDSVDRQRGPLTRGAFLAAAALWWAFVASVVLAVLWAAPSFAQAGQAAPPGSSCGPGLACKSRTFTATGAPGFLGSWCQNMAIPYGYSFGDSQSTSTVQLGWFGARGCSGAQTAQLNFNVNGTAYLRASLEAELGTSTTNRLKCDTSGCYASQPFGTGSTGTGTAFASFPVCSATNSGRLLYDSTNGRWRTCDGAGTWRVMAHEYTFGGYLADPGAPAANITIAETKPRAPAVVTNLHAQLTNAGPTSASGNYVIRVYDATAGAALCTLMKTCASGTGSTTCSGAVVAGNRLTIEADSSACGAGTVGAFNVVAHITGG